MYEKLLNDVYYNTKSPACFSGLYSVFKEAKKRNDKISREDVLQFLQNQPTYTKHRPIRKRFPRNKTVPIGYRSDFQADLCDMQNIKEYNKGYSYILTCIDVLSRQAWAEPLKTKSGENTSKAFTKILKSCSKEGIPWRLATDKGKEFLAKEFQSVLNEHEIQHIIPKNDDIKCSMVERYNRTLKSRLYKLFTKRNNYVWIDSLQDIVQAINNSVNRTTGLAPNAVNSTNAVKLWLKLYGKKGKTNIFKFKPEDQVRISKNKGIFEKGYLPSYSEEIFTVVKCINRIPPVYEIKDQNSDNIEGTFYGHELSKVIKKESDLYLIDKVLNTRIRNNKKEVYVSWQNYPSSFNSWEPADNIVSLNNST